MGYVSPIWRESSTEAIYIKEIFTTWRVRHNHVRQVSKVNFQRLWFYNITVGRVFHFQMMNGAYNTAALLRSCDPLTEFSSTILIDIVGQLKSYFMYLTTVLFSCWFNDVVIPQTPTIFRRYDRRRHCHHHHHHQQPTSRHDFFHLHHTAVSSLK